KWLNEELQANQENGSDDNQTVLPQKPVLLSDLITHDKSVEIVETIKITFKNIKGKRLKLLLKAMQDITPSLLPKDRIAKKFHDCCSNEFNWSIGSYTAMNDYSYNSNIDKDQFNEMTSFLKQW